MVRGRARAPRQGRVPRPSIRYDTIRYDDCGPTVRPDRRIRRFDTTEELPGRPRGVAEYSAELSSAERESRGREMSRNIPRNKCYKNLRIVTRRYTSTDERKMMTDERKMTTDDEREMTTDECEMTTDK